VQIREEVGDLQRISSRCTMSSLCVADDCGRGEGRRRGRDLLASRLSIDLGFEGGVSEAGGLLNIGGTLRRD
jgi:hypothetical protein